MTHQDKRCISKERFSVSENDHDAKSILSKTSIFFNDMPHKSSFKNHIKFKVQPFHTDCRIHCICGI